MYFFKWFVWFVFIFLILFFFFSYFSGVPLQSDVESVKSLVFSTVVYRVKKSTSCESKHYRFRYHMLFFLSNRGVILWNLLKRVRYHVLKHVKVLISDPLILLLFSFDLGLCYEVGDRNNYLILKLPLRDPSMRRNTNRNLSVHLGCNAAHPYY